MSDNTSNGRRIFGMRVAVGTPEKLAELAKERGFVYLGAGGEQLGAVGRLMDAIADGQITLT
jgi:hypothetical protein